jgi:hypothetical protein
MAKIRQQDLFEGDVFKMQRESAESTLRVVKDLKDSLLDIARASKEAMTGGNDGASVRKQAEAYEKATAAYSEFVKLEKEEAKLKAQITAATTAQAQAVEKERQTLNATKKAVRDYAKEEAGLLTAYEKKSKRLNELRRQYKHYVVATGANSKATREMRREVIALDKELKKIDASVGQYQRNVGNYRSAFGQLRSLAGTFGVGIGAGFIARDAFNIIKDFDQAMANLRAITGATGDEFAKLEADAKRLGSTTKFTASEVAELQTEYAKLGFTTPEILAATEATLSLAAATNMELGRAAEVAGATVRGFGLDASETQRVVDVMADSFNATALDAESFAEAMKYVAPIAAAAGVSVEETTAMLGALANAGVKGSQAGTSLRQVLSEMDKTGKSTAAALEDLSKKGLSLADAEDEVGKNAKTALLILTDQTKQTGQLTERFKNAGGAAERMANEQLDSLSGALDILRSAWEGFILELNDAGSSFFSLKDLILFVADNLKTIIKVVVLATTSWLAFKAALKIQGLITSIVTGLNGMRAAVVGIGTAAKAGTVGVKSLGTALKSIPFAGIATAVFTLVEAFVLFNDETSIGIQLQKQFNDALSEGQKIAAKAQATNDKLVDSLDKQIQQELAIARSKGATDEELRTKELELQNKALYVQQKQRQKITDSRLRAERDIKNLQAANLELEKKQARLQKEAERLTGQGFGRGVTGPILDEVFFAGEEIKENIKKIAAAQAYLNTSIETELNFKEKIADRQHQIMLLTNETATAAANTGEATSKVERHTKKAAEHAGDLAEKLKSVDEIISEGRDSAIERKMAALEKQYAIQVRNAEQSFTNEEEHQQRLLALEIQYLQRQLDVYMEFGDKYIKEQADLQAEIARLQRQRQTPGGVSGDVLNDIAASDNGEFPELTHYVDARRKMYNDLEELAEAFAERERRRAEERIADIDREIQAARERADSLRAIADQGNVDAQRSLSAEIAREKELEAQKKAIQRRQQLAEIGLTAFKTYNAKIQAGDDRPLLNTIRDITLLSAFVRNLPTFIEGTERVADDLPRSLNTGVDDFIVRVDGRERVLSPEENARLGNLSNEELVQIAESARAARSVQRGAVAATLIRSQWTDSAGVLRKFDELKQAIEMKPVHSLDYDKLSGAIIDRIEYKGRRINNHRRNNSIL